jgi:HSP20 family protein
LDGGPGLGAGPVSAVVPTPRLRAVGGEFCARRARANGRGSRSDWVESFCLPRDGQGCGQGVFDMGKVSSSVHLLGRPALAGRDPAEQAHWQPNTDLYTTEEGLVVKVELAGMSREHLEITVEGNRLCIRGHRPDSCRAARCNFLIMEITYGPFERVLELPECYDLSRARAAYVNGFLRIDVPLARSPGPGKKRLDIGPGQPVD